MLHKRYFTPKVFSTFFSKTSVYPPRRFMCVRNMTTQSKVWWISLPTAFHNLIFKKIVFYWNEIDTSIHARKRYATEIFEWYIFTFFHYHRAQKYTVFYNEKKRRKNQQGCECSVVQNIFPLLNMTAKTAVNNNFDNRIIITSSQNIKMRIIKWILIWSGLFH